MIDFGKQWCLNIMIGFDQILLFCVNLKTDATEPMRQNHKKSWQISAGIFLLCQSTVKIFEMIFFLNQNNYLKRKK